MLRGGKTAAPLGELSLVYLSLRGGASFGWIGIRAEAGMQEGMCVARSECRLSLCDAVTVRGAFEVLLVLRMLFFSLN